MYLNFMTCSRDAARESQQREARSISTHMQVLTGVDKGKGIRTKAVHGRQGH